VIVEMERYRAIADRPNAPRQARRSSCLARIYERADLGECPARILPSDAAPKAAPTSACSGITPITQKPAAGLELERTIST